MEYQKVKSAAKRITVKSPQQSHLILSTMKTISDIVGVTLGPGGRAVIVERFEHGMPPMVTKDGVTVMRALGLSDPVAHCVLECARDAAVKTASEAGDGTTTATILSESIVRFTHDYCKRHENAPPQKVVRVLESTFSNVIEPAVRKMSMKANRALLRSVAKVSANGEEPLADAVMQCFDLVGDEGNVTIIEQSGPTGYQVEVIDGYPINMGYEDSCAKFYSAFINDASTQKVVMERPVFVLYHGLVNDIQTILGILQKVGDEFQKKSEGIDTDYNHTNVVVVAVGFSEKVLGAFAHASSQPDSIRIFPLVVPLLPFTNGQRQFLDDLAAVTGATVFDPVTNPVSHAKLEDLGPGTIAFECSRFRSVILGHAEGFVLDVGGNETGITYEGMLLERVGELEALLSAPESEMDKYFLKERIGKLTGGIAKLRVIGSSNGELKERRDRAEDAVCAVRGALKHGCLPGGGWTLLKLCNLLEEKDSIVSEVLKPALLEPVYRLFSNCGFTPQETKGILEPILEGIRDDKIIVYDAYEHKHGDPVALGILDSTPAVLEAIRNSLSIASLLGTLGGTVVFQRDGELERTEARDTQDWMRNANINPADERP